MKQDSLEGRKSWEEEFSSNFGKEERFEGSLGRKIARRMVTRYRKLRRKSV